VSDLLSEDKAKANTQSVWCSAESLVGDIHVYCRMVLSSEPEKTKFYHPKTDKAKPKTERVCLSRTRTHERARVDSPLSDGLIDGSIPKMVVSLGVRMFGLEGLASVDLVPASMFESRYRSWPVLYLRAQKLWKTSNNRGPYWKVSKAG